MITDRIINQLESGVIRGKSLGQMYDQAHSATLSDVPPRYAAVRITPHLSYCKPPSRNPLPDFCLSNSAFQ